MIRRKKRNIENKKLMTVVYKVIIDEMSSKFMEREL
jgi:hypothetical protein